MGKIHGIIHTSSEYDCYGDSTFFFYLQISQFSELSRSYWAAVTTLHTYRRTLVYLTGFVCAIRVFKDFETFPVSVERNQPRKSMEN